MIKILNKKQFIKKYTITSFNNKNTLKIFNTIKTSIDKINIKSLFNKNTSDF